MDTYILDVLKQLLHQFGYFGIFSFLMLGIIALPLPDEFALTFLGSLAAAGKLSVYKTYFSALAGSVTGITISYFIGSKLGYPFLIKYGKILFITRRRLRITQLLFRKYGNILLVIAYFIPGVRHMTAYLAGISKTPFWQFALYAYTGAIIWCATFIGLGHYLGKRWRIAEAMIKQYGVYVFIIFFVIVVGAGILIWKKNKRLFKKF